MAKRFVFSLIATVIYLVVSNIGNLFFGISRSFSWTTTLWEALFFFIFIFLIQQFRKK
jgi:hypothetical protein